HVKLQQTLHGLPVVGAEYIVHADRQRNVIGMNGRFAQGRDLPREATVDGWSAVQRAAEQMGASNANYSKWPTLTYVVNERGNAFLAWTVEVSYTSDQGQERDTIYADATSGDL